MTNHSYLIVVYQCDCKPGKKKSEILKEYKKMTRDRKQKYRKEKDLSELKELNQKKRYHIDIKRTSHYTLPNRIMCHYCNKLREYDFFSNIVLW